MRAAATAVGIPESRPTLVAPDGDAVAVEALARLLFGTASRYDDFAETARTARPDGTWAGRAYEAYLGATGRAAREHELLAVAVRRVARTCAASSDTLTELLATHRRLVADKGGCDARRTRLVAEVAAAGATAAPAELTALRARARALDRDYAAVVEDHRVLRRRVRDNEQLLLRAFAGTTTLAQVLSGRGGVDPEAAAAMGRSGAPGSDAGPAAVRAWWRRLTDAERRGVVAGFPRLMGRAAGLPARVRDRANRVVLDDVVTELEQRDRDGTLTDRERHELATARATQRALRDADRYLDPVTGRPAGGLLWSFDPGAFDGDGSVVVAVGDPDTADDVAVRVPGIANDGTTIAGLTRAAILTYQSARAGGDGSSVASMAWLGYDAPSGPTDGATYSLHRADAGGDALAHDVAGLQAARPDGPAHLTLVGHSYGSAVVGQALLDHPGLSGSGAVGDAVLVGSPGIGVDHAAQLGLGADHVWVGAASDDAVTHVHPLGPDPAAADFGGLRFQAEDPTRDGLWDLGHHAGYFESDTESADNLGHVVDGSTGEVELAAPRHDEAYPMIVDGAGHTVTAHHTVDPEASRPATSGVPGLSATGVPTWAPADSVPPRPGSGAP